MSDPAAIPNGSEAPPRRGALARLSTGRGFLALVGLMFLLFLLLGEISGPVALVLYVAILALFLALSEPRAKTPIRFAERQAPSVWPETAAKQMADALPEPCIILDRRGIVRYSNRLAEAAFPIRPGDPLALRLRAPDFVGAFERVAAGGTAERVEFVERVPTERWYTAWFAPLDPRDGGSRNGFVVLIFSDQTERRRSEKIRVDFVANASHELRTPLASLSGFIETLQGPARDDTVARERFLAIMHEQATRMSRLIDDLLSLSRIEMKAHMVPRDQVDLSTVIGSVVDALEPLAHEQGVAIETELPPEPVAVIGDRDEIFQVFQNLIENACKYGRAGGRVRVELKPAGNGKGSAVTVRDFGPGIAPQHLPRLTERFYRADIEASRNQRGTGLGLAIVKHILNRHRARLLVESKPGEGAAFTVEFPRATLPILAGA